MATGAAPFGEALAEMLGILDDFLPGAVAPLPDASISVANLSERSVGLGGLRGLEFRERFQVAELKALRLDALVRYDLWGDSPGAATQAAGNVGAGLLGARDTLASQGILKLGLEGLDAPDFAASLNAWHVGALYRVLYEFPYQDAGGAESLVVRIPIDVPPEEPGAAIEETVVTDEMTRWDDDAAPALVVRGPFGVGALLGLSWFSAAAPTGGVTVTRTFDGASGAPAAFGSLDAFFDAVSGFAPLERHGSVAFPTLVDFLVAIGAAGVPVAIGDRDADGVLDLYVPRSRVVLPPLVLETEADRMEVAYGAVALDQPAVVYLRATRG
jgi:hypothetical protein